MEHRLKYGYSGERPFKEDDNLSFYKGYHKGQGVSVLICEFKITGGTSEKNAMKKQEMLTLEPILDRISRIDHKNVAKIYDVVKTDSGLVVVQEDCAQGTLMSLLKTHEFIEEKLAIFITKQVAQGLQQLHRNGIIHGYVNLQNIQMDNNGNWKVSARSLVLKQMYLSPEFKLNSMRSKQGDIFSLGIAFYKMMFGVFPYSGKTTKQIIENIEKGQRRAETILDSKLPFKIVISNQVDSLVSKMINFKVESRPGLDFIIADINETLKDDISKNRKLSPQFDQSYIVYGFTDRSSTVNYANEVLMTGYDKILKEFRKFKVISYNRQQQRDFEQYKRRLSKFISNNDAKNSGLIQIKEIIEARSTAVLVYEYFNQNTLEDYLLKVQQGKKSHVMDEIQAQDVISAFTQTLTTISEAHAWVSAPRIFIKNGKAKIGQPAFETEQVRRRLFTSRQQIDEIAPQKKKSRSPVAPQPSMDTWSVGVVFYKLLYGSNPIFGPDRTPIFPKNRNLKQNQVQRLASYLKQNPKERNPLQDLDPSKPFPGSLVSGSNIQPDTRLRRASSIRKTAQPRSVMGQGSQLNIQQDLQINLERVEDLKNNKNSRQVNSQNISKDQDSEDDDCFQKGCIYLSGCVTLHHLDEAGFFSTLTNSWTRKIRFALKVIFSFTAYIFLFYMAFFNICGNILVQRNSFQSASILTRRNINDSVPTVNFSVVTTSPTFFTSYYNTTQTNLSNDMNCAKNNFYVGPYGDQIYLDNYLKSQNFLAFTVIGFIIVMMHLIMKGLQICKLDMSRIMNSIKQKEGNKYSKVLSYVFTELGLASLFSIHYLLYGSLYHMLYSPCLTNPPLPSVNKLFSGSTGTFILLYIWQYIGLLIVYIYIIYFTSFLKTKEVSNYIWILLLMLYIAGVGTRGMGGFVGSQTPFDSMVSVFGVCGELLEIITMVICGLIDAIFWRAIRRKKKIQQQARSRVQLFDQSHATIQNTENNEET